MSCSAPLISTILPISSSVVPPDERGRSQEMLKKWSLRNEVEHQTLVRLSYAPEQHCHGSMRALTEADADFFDALCEFNFGLLAQANNVLASILMNFIHVVVGHS